MIVVRLIGGLGNQMFQYGIGRHLSIINDTDLGLDISGFEYYKLHKYSLQHFDIKAQILNQPMSHQIYDPLRIKSKIKNIFSYEKKYRIVKELHFQFDPEYKKITDTTYLDGYWQCENYFVDIKQMILKEFSVKTELKAKNLEIANIISSNNDAIGLHVRRGDYVSNERTNKVHGVCDLNYYNRAITELLKTVDNPRFFVFSDDPTWVADNIKLKHETHYINHNDATTNYEDLRLMSLCNHNVIANSSFSWWGAWLNPNPNKKVICPKNWFAEDNSRARDICPNDWIKL